MSVTSLKYKTKLGTLAAPGDVDPGAMIPLQTITVGSTSVASITFSSIPQNYEHLQIRLLVREATGGFDQAYMQINGDSGTNYAKHTFGGAGSNSFAYGGTADATSVSIAAIPGSNQAANVFGASIVDILDYTNTNKYTTIRAISGTDNNGSGYQWFASGLWENTNPVTSLTIFAAGGPNLVQYTHAALYGIKKAGA